MSDQVISKDSGEGGEKNVEDDSDWEVGCSDEEVESYMPPPATIVKLFTALANKEPITLDWQCPPKRPLTPDISDSEEEVEIEEAKQMAPEEAQTISDVIEPTEFDFADSTPISNKSIKLRKGGTKLPLSAQRKVGQFQNVVKTVNRHSLEEKELHIQRKQDQQKRVSIQQQQQQFVVAQPNYEQLPECPPGTTVTTETMEWQPTMVQNTSQHMESILDDNLPADIDIDPDFETLTIKTDKACPASIEQYIAESQLDQIDNSDFALLTDLEAVEQHLGCGSDVNTMAAPGSSVAAWPPPIPDVISGVGTTQFDDAHYYTATNTTPQQQ